MKYKKVAAYSNGRIRWKWSLLHLEREGGMRWKESADARHPCIDLYNSINELLKRVLSSDNFHLAPFLIYCSRIVRITLQRRGSTNERAKKGTGDRSNTNRFSFRSDSIFPFLSFLLFVREREREMLIWVQVLNGIYVARSFSKENKFEIKRTMQRMMQLPTCAFFEPFCGFFERIVFFFLLFLEKLCCDRFDK